MQTRGPGRQRSQQDRPAYPRLTQSVRRLECRLASNGRLSYTGRGALIGPRHCFRGDVVSIFSRTPEPTDRPAKRHHDDHPISVVTAIAPPPSHRGQRRWSRRGCRPADASEIEPAHFVFHHTATTENLAN